MKKIFLILGLLFSFSAYSQIDRVLPNPPNPPTLYNDFTKGKNFITPEQRDFLERKLVAYDDSTSNQVAIVIVDDLHDYEANEFATALGRKWGIGSKEFNNGILILISTGGSDGNRDAYIAVGYGLEGAVPDITAKTILENTLIPNFKNGDFFKGLNGSVDDIIKAAAGEYKAPEGYRKKKGLQKWQIILFVFAIWIILGLASRGGKGGGGYASRRGYRGLGGPFWWGTGGGFGGFGGGSSGGGGFGGFGGGGFGGGGAGGKW